MPPPPVEYYSYSLSQLGNDDCDLYVYIRMYTFFFRVSAAAAAEAGARILRCWAGEMSPAKWGGPVVFSLFSNSPKVFRGWRKPHDRLESAQTSRCVFSARLAKTNVSSSSSSYDFPLASILLLLLSALRASHSLVHLSTDRRWWWLRCSDSSASERRRRIAAAILTISPPQNGPRLWHLDGRPLWKNEVEREERSEMEKRKSPANRSSITRVGIIIYLSAVAYFGFSFSFFCFPFARLVGFFTSDIHNKWRPIQGSRSTCRRKR